MIDLTEHPIALLLIVALSVPIYRGLALVVFGNREKVAAAVKYLKTPENWDPLKDPMEEDWGMVSRILLFTGLCIGFIVASYDLVVRYVLSM